MREKLLLAGAGGFGRVILEHAIKEYDCAFVDDGPFEMVDGIPVIGKTRDLDRLYPEYKLLLVTIGDNALRKELYERAAMIGYSFPNIIVASAYISPRAAVGKGCIILNNAVVQNHARIGDGVILNAGVEVHQDSVIGDYVLIYANSVVRSLAHVGNRAWIGSTATIANRAVVPDGSVVEDGAVVKPQEIML